MKKRIYLVLLTALLTCGGCAKEIPEGKIKDFVIQFTFDRAFEHVNTGISIIKATYYINDKVDGSICSTTYFDKTTKEKYYYMNTDVTGSFIGDGQDQYTYQNRKTLTYITPDEKIMSFQKTDGNDDEIHYIEEDVIKSINNFFYLQLESGYHQGGVYYGDYVLANCGKYYPCFSLDEETNLLRYQVNTKSQNSKGGTIYSLHDFYVDEYGMVINLSSKAIYYEENITMETTIACSYNIPIEKLSNL